MVGRTRERFSRFGLWLSLTTFAAAAPLLAQQPPPDNTKVNKAERAGGQPTAEQQKNNRSDLTITRDIRRSIVGDNTLSTYAHNVKIITRQGQVTLKGPVRTEGEKVFGIYPSYASAERAVDALRDAGFRSTDISVLFPENVGTKDFAHKKGTKAPEGATTGASAGAVVGGTLGWLTGIGALAIPGLGPFIAAGPIMAALAGIGVGGAVGGVTGALIGMGIPEYEAKRYEGRLIKGGILLSVHSDDSDWKKRAKTVLEQTGAEDISSTGETKGDVQNADKPMLRAGVI